MKTDLPPQIEQPNHDRDAGMSPFSTPSHELERTSSPTPEVVSSADNLEVVNIMQLLLERGISVDPGTQIIKSPFDDGMLYDVTHFYGVETRLPNGVARYTVRAWNRTYSDEYRDYIINQRTKAGLPPESHEKFLEEEGAKGILVVSSWTDADDASNQQRKVEDVLGYVHPNGSTAAAIYAESGTVDPSVPESLMSPFVTPDKLSGTPITLEDARLEGDLTRKKFEGEPYETLIRRALGKIGIRRKKF